MRKSKNKKEREIKMEIIKFKEEYRKYFIDFNKNWILSHFGTLEENDYQTFEKIDEELEKGGMIFFAIEDEIPLACCMVVPIENDTWELCKMGSNSNVPHKGAGSLVFQAAMDWAITHQAKRLFIISNSSLKAALHIYEKYGFQEVKLENYGYHRGDIAFEYVVNKSFK